MIKQMKVQVKKVQRKKILVPAFAIGRSQQVIYHVAEMVAKREIPGMPIYLDSPMAVDATQAYGRHRDLFDEEAMAHVKSGDLRPALGDVHFIRTVDESKALNGLGGPMMIIVAEFERSVQTYPLVPSGAPDPYRPPPAKR